jgi:Na+/alanine symporter
MKKILKLSIVALASFAIPFMAFAQSTTISLGDDFNNNTWNQVQNILTGLSPQIEMILGVILAAVVLEIIIGAIKK